MSELNTLFDSITLLDSHTIEALKKNYETIRNTTDKKVIDELTSALLGKQSPITLALRNMKTLPNEEKRIQGPALNKLHTLIKQAVKAKQNPAHIQPEETIKDYTLPYWPNTLGKLHPITHTIETCTRILSAMGFEKVSGPERDSDENNFQDLNIPENHPARQMQDTFFLKSGNMLRTHTTNTDIHVLKNHTLPLKTYTIGRVFRRDADKTHSPMFHQLDVLYVDKDINVKNLLWFLRYFLNAYFQEEYPIRFRASYFPFTAISLEADILRDDQWIEVLGAGILHPNVLTNCGIDPDIYKGFALGVGLERLTMLAHGISDLRDFFEGDLQIIHANGIGDWL